jgi:paraquat-inducible protein B
MAIELAEAVAEKSQLKLIEESRVSKLERHFELNVKIVEQEMHLNQAKSKALVYKNQIKDLKEDLNKLLNEINSGQTTLSITIEQAAPEDSDDDLNDIDLENLEEDEAGEETLEPTEAEAEALQEGAGFYQEDERPEVEEVQTEVEEEAPEGIEPEPNPKEVD